ncbi:MAG: hypothetical protein KAI47_14145, partial [Deltaproteobacteria bacterium]|nr:hypothetical protein [Deltaproteobacteria bacterium]
MRGQFHAGSVLRGGGVAVFLVILFTLWGPRGAFADAAIPGDATSVFRLSRRGSKVILEGADGALLSLLPTLVVRHNGRSWTARFVLTPPSHATSRSLAKGGRALLLRATARGPTLKAILEISRAGHDPELFFRVTRRYLRGVRVQREALRFHVPSGVVLRAVDRMYRLRRVRAPLLAGVASPVVVLFERGLARLAWFGSTSLSHARLRPRRRLLEMELDDRRSHPLRAFARCQRHLRRYPPPRRDLGATPRRRGERVVATGRFVLGPRILVAAQRYPDGYAAALSFTDHADQSSTDRLEAFAFGATGALARGEVGPQRPGFVNRGLRYTKTVFLRRSHGYEAQFDSPRYRSVLAALARRGTEIGVHSPSGARDRPALARSLLGPFVSAYHGQNWIDHQPYTNCEALSMKGLDPHSPWFMLGELARVGIRYVWAAPDVRLAPRTLNMLRGSNPALHRPAIFTHKRLRYGAKRFVAFRSVMLFQPRRRLLRRFSPVALSRLIADRGLLIGHVYFDSCCAHGRFRVRSLLRRCAAGGYALRPDVDALFQRLAVLQAQKALWVTGVEALARHLLDALAVSVRYRR